MALKEFAGAAPATRLSGSLAAGTTTNFTVISGGGSGYPTGSTAPFVVVINRGTALEEKILVTSRAGDVFTGLSRSYDGTTAPSGGHSAQAVVEHVLDAATLTEANAHVNTTTRDDHTQYLKTDGTRGLTATTAIAAATVSTSAVADAAFAGSGTTLSLGNHRHAREVGHWTGHTFAIAGDVVVAVGDLDYVVPFFIPEATGRTVKIVKAFYRINSGTSATVKLQNNGVDITGYTGIAVTTTTSTTDPADVNVVDRDLIALVVTGVSGSPKNLTFTVVLEHT